MVDVETPSLRLSPRTAPSAASRSLTIPCGRTRLRYQGRPLIMGILNVTPDSFSDGGRYAGAAAAIARGVEMARDGADLIDIGGESTRPRSAPVPVEEELRRVLPVIAGLSGAVRVPLSIDTSKAQVASRAIEAGAGLINDVTALRGDPAMARTAARGRAAVILMHMRGIPQTMQRAPHYRDVVEDVAGFLRQAAARAEAAGIARQRILLDPGLGFGKTARHNLVLLRALERLMALGYPVVVGPSRKSFIGETLEAPIEARLAGTLACVARACAAGAHVVRVHDVRAARDVVRMLDAIAHA